MPEVQVREHQWVEFAVTPVTLMPDDEGKPIAVAIPGKEKQITVGCFACDMGMDEGYGISCPGRDLFEDL